MTIYGYIIDEVTRWYIFHTRPRQTIIIIIVNLDLVTACLLFYCRLFMGIFTGSGSELLGNERLRLSDLILDVNADVSLVMLKLI